MLVVDDDPLLVEIVTRKLQASGFRVEAATDGLAGLERARALEPDLIVLDQVMPKMDGHEVLRAIRTDSRLWAVPIIMLTARRGESDVADALSLGASDFISKPFSPGELHRIGGPESWRRQGRGPSPRGDLWAASGQALGSSGRRATRLIGSPSPDCR